MESLPSLVSISLFLDLFSYYFEFFAVLLQGIFKLNNFDLRFNFGLNFIL